MVDGWEPAGTPGARQAHGRVGIRRIGRWCAAALAVGSAVVLGAGPASAAPLPGLVVYPEYNVIEKGTTGPAKFGYVNTSDVSYTNDGRMRMELYAPSEAYFADRTLTPLGNAPGPWTCTWPLNRKVLHCYSDYKGVMFPAGQTTLWQVNVTVPANVYTPGIPVLSTEYSWFYTECTQNPVDQTEARVRVATGPLSA
ncbi:hypothetical protein [Streptomyces sp. BPTC-684]|uniref:hypothetical protein n=1 Tax=Streptomyces sp. BPTC-684 TaxID=3043734 RepID=UPI0024B0EA33|nr:hypothetical protein [Streptomyces sp. BPTC-684]WHM40991.1 hypothetical protein QIY60_31735 [Streptomyces sp. BPTC-684]